MTRTSNRGIPIEKTSGTVDCHLANTQAREYELNYNGKERNKYTQYIFSDRYGSLFALTAAISWGWAYPLIKMGMDKYQITADMTGSKMLFAGSCLDFRHDSILAIARSSHTAEFGIQEESCSRDCSGFFSSMHSYTTLHYAFFYFGLSHNAGARCHILFMSVFTVVILACIFFKSDSMTWQKALGCIIGFLGILALNSWRKGKW